MGESSYVIPSAEDVQAVYRAPKALYYDPFIKEILSMWGISTDTASKMFDTFPGHSKNWMETTIDNFKQQLHPGDKLDAVQKRLLGFIDKLLVWDRLQGRMVLQETEKYKVVSLFSWGEMVIVDAQTRAFFDEVLYKKCPDLLAHFQTFESESWKLPMGLPDFATKVLRSSKSAMEEGLKQYLDIPSNERPNDSWLVRTMCESMEKIGVEHSQKVLVLSSFFRT
jgi:cholesterol 7alpha-monooxygenase